MKFEEYESANILIRLLEEHGFTIEKGVAGIETAFVATYGTGNPVIGLLGEYDALADLSQEAGSATKVPVEKGGNGHGCGHNLLGVSMAGAAIALRYLLQEQNVEGKIKFYGWPAEEGGSGKTFMVRDGVFNGVDIALTWHPGDRNEVAQGSSLANYQMYYQFTGKSSHAAISPHLGRSALDAVELMNVGANYLREHIIPEARMHYAVTNSGGASPNVVQPFAEVLYLIRAPKIKEVQEIYNRMNKIAEGAALMTGTEVEVVFDKACSNVIPNRTLYTLMHETFEEIGVPVHTKEELQFAEDIVATLGSNHTQEALAKELEPIYEDEATGFASTDVGDVSWVVPTVQCSTVCFAKGTPFHSWQMVSQGKTSIGHKGMIHASKVVSATALKLFKDPNIVKKATEEWDQRLNDEIGRASCRERVD